MRTFQATAERKGAKDSLGLCANRQWSERRLNGQWRKQGLACPCVSLSPPSSITQRRDTEEGGEYGLVEVPLNPFSAGQESCPGSVPQGRNSREKSLTFLRLLP